MLKLIHDCVPESERRNWTHRDRTLSFHVSMCFADHDEINSDVNSDDYSFRRQDAIASGSIRRRAAPGSGGVYDFTLTNGCQIKKFHTLKAASHSNLSPSNANKKYMFKVVPLNPYLASIPSFYANSVPFVVKSNFHTECSNLAFILDDTGAVVADVKTNRVVSAGASAHVEVRTFVRKVSNHFLKVTALTNLASASTRPVQNAPAFTFLASLLV